MKRVEGLRNRIVEEGLKVTPQRLATLQAILSLNNHPSADQIINFVQSAQPNIAIGTVYKTLETFVEKGIVRKVYTESDVTRYDAAGSDHHHLYYSGSSQIEDYYNEELTVMIRDYLSNHSIPDFIIEDVKLHILGKRGKIHKSGKHTERTSQ